MYNEEQKLRFLETVDQTKYSVGFWDRAFRDSLEEIKGKDLYDYTITDIRDLYGYLSSRSVERLKVLNYAYSSYTQWAIEQNLVKDRQNHYLEMTNDILVNCVDKNTIEGGIISREELLKAIQLLDNARDRYIILALYEGFKGKNFEEITKLQISDVDTKKKIATVCTGRKLRMSSELVSSIIESDQTNEYYSVKNGARSVYKLKDGGVFKLVDTKLKTKQTDTNMSHLFCRIIEKSNLSHNVSATSLRMSGIVNAISDAMKEYDMDYTTLIQSKHFKWIKQQYSLSRSGIWRIKNTYFQAPQ